MLWLARSPSQAPLPETLDKVAAQWVEDTFKKMTLDDKVGQLVVSSLNSTYLASDTETFDAPRREGQRAAARRLPRVRRRRADPERAAQQQLRHRDARAAARGGVAAESAADAVSTIPLLNTADFEAGVGFRIQGATAFPRAMAVGAAGDEQLAFDAARITALEARAIGVHVNFAPIADVNNNPRNPVINTRAFGEIAGRRRPARERRTSAACTPAACSRR